MSSVPSHAEIPGPEVGRWLLERLVAEGVRYGRDFAIVRVSVPSGAVRDLAPMLAFVLRDADVLVRWSETELLALLPATDREGAARTAERLRDAAEGMAASVRAAHWVGDTAQDLLSRVGAR
jgi:Diguanylate cyclase, GGDEF domain